MYETPQGLLVEKELKNKHMAQLKVVKTRIKGLLGLISVKDRDND